MDRRIDEGSFVDVDDRKAERRLMLDARQVQWTRIQRGIIRLGTQVDLGDEGLSFRELLTDGFRPLRRDVENDPRHLRGRVRARLGNPARLAAQQLRR